MSITTKTFETPHGVITHYTLTNSKGACVTLSTLGAAIVSIIVPDKNGKLDNVVLGYKDPASWMSDGPCAGKVPGRYANRIALGKFTLDGEEYSLAINNGPNALHGGPTGFQNRIWNSSVDDDGDIVFSYCSRDGEEGYPGNLIVYAIYHWDDDNTLTLLLNAVTDKATVINLTNHVYFNLDGESSGTVLDHELRIAASHYLATDDTQIPTGEIAPVAGTPMDFMEFKTIGRDINADFHPLKVGKGYDHCWVLDSESDDDDLKEAAWLKGSRSGRRLIVSTSQPGIQVYTGNWLEGCPESISGNAYHDYDGVALECQNFPDAPNHSDFPLCVLRPGEIYEEVIKFEFK